MMNYMRYEWDVHDLSHGGPQITARVELVIFDKGKAIVKFVAPQLCVKKPICCWVCPNTLDFSTRVMGYDMYQRYWERMGCNGSFAWKHCPLVSDISPLHLI